MSRELMSRGTPPNAPTHIHVTQLDILVTHFERHKTMGKYYVGGDETSREEFCRQLQVSKPSMRVDSIKVVESDLDFLDSWFDALDDPKFDVLTSVLWDGAKQHPNVNPMPKLEWDVMMGKCKDRYVKWDMDRQRKWLAKFIQYYIDNLPAPGDFDILNYQPPFCLGCMTEGDGPCNCDVKLNGDADKFVISKQQCLIHGKFKQYIDKLLEDYTDLSTGCIYKEMMVKVMDLVDCVQRHIMGLDTARKIADEIFQQHQKKHADQHKRWEKCLTFIKWYRIMKSRNVELRRYAAKQTTLPSREQQIINLLNDPHRPQPLMYWPEVQEPADGDAMMRVQFLFIEAYVNLMHPGNFRSVAMVMCARDRSIDNLAILRRLLDMTFSSVEHISILSPEQIVFEKMSANPAIRNNVCHTCFKTVAPGIKLKRCSKCKMTYFCGTDCMMALWPRHKTDCPVLAKRFQEKQDDKTKIQK